MESKTADQLDKLAHIMRSIDTLYLLRNEEFNDHARRVILRYFFVQLDNLEKISGRIKNLLFDEGQIDAGQRSAIEEAIKKLLKGYTASYEVVRDKLAAHSQPLDLELLLAWWYAIDYTAIEILYGDVKILEDAFRAAKCVTHPPVGADYARFESPSHGPLSMARNKPHIANDRLGLSKQGAVSMIPAHETQEKAQLVLSIIDFLEVDFALTLIADNPQSVFQIYACDIAWLLTIADSCSLLDNLFEDDARGNSLLSKWKSHKFKGSHYLEKLSKTRDLVFEAQLRTVRNRFAAHIDAESDFKTLYKEYLALDIGKLHAYVHTMVRGFHQACQEDIRSNVLLIHGQALPNVVGLRKTVKPFDDV